MKQMQWVLCLLMVHVLGQALLQLCAKHKDPEGQEGRLEVPRPSQFVEKPFFTQNYHLKAEFSLQCSPEEILRLLLDDKQRQLWDFRVKQASINRGTNELVVVYNRFLLDDDPAESPEYTETIQIKYMVDQGKFYIFEHVKNNLKKEYDRVWIV